MEASVVIVTYRRMENLKEIVSAWKQETKDVWLCDCSKNGVPFDCSGINYVRFAPDPGNRVRHAVALLTSGELVIKADDDLVPKKGLVNDFIFWYNKLGNAVLGIHGRTFEGHDYYRNTTLYAGHKVPEPVPVDFVGVITCSPRVFLPMDLKDCGTAIEDLFWQNKCYPGIPKYVVPTNKYSHFRSSRDPGRLCGNQDARKIRRAFYQKYYEIYYEA